MNSSALLTPRQAADKIGISYPALKHWILAGRIRTVKTPGGHHRVPLEALQEFLPATDAHTGSGRLSGRNQLIGSRSSWPSATSASPPSSPPTPSAS
jgi:excisionase family DNA binding protein